MILKTLRKIASVPFFVASAPGLPGMAVAFMVGFSSVTATQPVWNWSFTTLMIGTSLPFWPFFLLGCKIYGIDDKEGGAS